MMAVAMEVGWRGSDLASPSYSHMKHKAPSAATSSSSWGGADPQKVLQLMMGQGHESCPTLDLFGSTSAPASTDDGQPDEFVELDPDLPLPSGWEKCLDLKSGKVYYVNRHTGSETYSDPRKQSIMISEAESSLSPQTRDFLGSKESENEKLGDYPSAGRSPPCPSISGRDARDECKPSSTFNGTREQWGHGWLGGGARSRTTSSVVGDATINGLELKLNLHAKTQQHSVCTLEKVEMALMRSEKMLGKSCVSLPDQQLLRSNVSPSPSTSSSSTSTSSQQQRPSLVSYQLLDKENQNSNKRLAAAADTTVQNLDGEVDTTAKEMVMVGGCKNCLMFVMLSKANPMCPRCGTSAALDFGSPPVSSSKRRKFESVE